MLEVQPVVITTSTYRTRGDRQANTTIDSHLLGFLNELIASKGLTKIAAHNQMLEEWLTKKLQSSDAPSLKPFLERLLNAKKPNRTRFATWLKGSVYQKMRTVSALYDLKTHEIIDLAASEWVSNQMENIDNLTEITKIQEKITQFKRSTYAIK